MPSDIQCDIDLQALVDLYLAEMPARAEALRLALTGGDRAQLQRLAHRLKGSAGQYGFPALSTHAAVLERLVRDGADVNAIHGAAMTVLGLCDGIAKQHVTACHEASS